MSKLRIKRHGIYIICSMFLSLVGCASRTVSSVETVDENLWLEDIHGEKQLAWVKAKNANSLKSLLNSKGSKKALKEANAIFNSKDKVPKVSVIGDYLYTLWQDEKSPRGKWKRAMIADKYASPAQWETVLDLDVLSKNENKSWTLNGAKCLRPEGQRCLLMLSNGGSDRGIAREFDTVSKTFVKNGFNTAEAKYWVDWIDGDNIALATDYGPNTVTDSGYGRELRILGRGNALEKAIKVLDVPQNYLTVITENAETDSGPVNLSVRYLSQADNDTWVVTKSMAQKIPIPNSAVVEGVFKDKYIVSLKTDWAIHGRKFEQGDIVAINGSSLGKQLPLRNDVELVFHPNHGVSILSVAITKDFIALNVLENVKGKILLSQYENNAFRFLSLNLPKVDSHLQKRSVHFNKNILIFEAEDFLVSPRLYSVDLKTKKVTLIMQEPDRFNTQGMIVKQEWAESSDKVKIPYFLVGSAKSITHGHAPVIMEGYGGFGVSNVPEYNAVIGKDWLEKGNLFVVANIRGGAEFGPQWHKAALGAKRQTAFNDFIAVAEDLVKKGITTPKQLGILGGSNGGFLMGAVMVQRPDLFGAVAFRVPLLDMLRFSKLLAGSAWIGEYGDPDNPKDKMHLIKTSPYQNLKANVQYPPVFLYTSTNDDRVHPGHARKFAARLESLGKNDVLFYENMEGGHAGSATPEQKALLHTLTVEFYKKNLKK